PSPILFPKLKTQKTLEFTLTPTTTTEREGEMMKRLVPTFNRILVKRVIQPAKTESGILLPEKSSSLNSGKVIAVGPGSRDKDGKLIPVSVKEGDTVLLPEYGGTQVKLGDNE
ncbi:unnamed protein product, partial [Brassica rapa subsp. trilocularis]